MKNKMKMLALVFLVSSVAHVDAKTEGGLLGGLGDWYRDAVGFMRANTPTAHAGKVVEKLNSLHQYSSYFPGTYPLNDRACMNNVLWYGTEALKRVGCDLPAPIISKSISPSIQLGFTVLCKWLPAALIVRAVWRKVTKKKKHKKRSVRCGQECQHCASHS